MATVYETGHAINISNFEYLISFCSNPKVEYKPNEEHLQINSLKKLLADTKTAMSNVTAKVIVYNKTVEERAEIFNNLKPLVFKMVQALTNTNSSNTTISNFKVIARKIQGYTFILKPLVGSAAEGLSYPDGKTVHGLQQNYKYMIDNYIKLINTLKNVADYAPEEDFLSIESLVSVVDTLNEANDIVATAYERVNEEREKRNDFLYHKDTGLIEVAKDVKRYFKLAFGETSPEFQRLGSYTFTFIR